MSDHDALWSDMDTVGSPSDRFALDAGTERRLLGGLPADDAPPAYAGVARLLAAASAEPSADELADEARAIAGFRAICAPRPTTHRTRSTLTVKTRTVTKLVGAGLAGFLTLGSGLAAAGALPGAAQDVASDMLEKVGVTVPGANEHSAGHADERGRSGDHVPADAGTEADEPVEAVADETTDVEIEDAGENGKGAMISDLATTTESEGVDKGAEISTAASDGRSQAGQHGGGDAVVTEGDAPVDTPNDGGTDTADTASNGASAMGTQIANERSGGRAAAGRGNAASHAE